MKGEKEVGKREEEEKGQGGSLIGEREEGGAEKDK